MLHIPRWRCRALRAGRAHFRRNPVCHDYRDTWNHHNRCLHDGRLPCFSRGDDSLCSSFRSIARRTYGKDLGRSGICGCERASAGVNEGHGYRQVALLVEWPCTLSIARVQSAFAREYPTRQPVIAYVLENDPAMQSRLRNSDLKEAALKTSAGG